MVTRDIVEPPSSEDQIWLRRAEDHIFDLFVDHLGEATFSHDPADLALAQWAIDAGVVLPTDELGMQSIGVILGNVFDTQTEMKWAVVTNDYGRLLALHAPRLGFTLYPLQMIGKRMRAGEAFDVPSLYRSFVQDLALLPA